VQKLIPTRGEFLKLEVWSNHATNPFQGCKVVIFFLQRADWSLKDLNLNGVFYLVVFNNMQYQHLFFFNGEKLKMGLNLPILLCEC
jgi:hypothetical protein